MGLWLALLTPAYLTVAGAQTAQGATLTQNQFQAISDSAWSLIAAKLGRSIPKPTVLINDREEFPNNHNPGPILDYEARAYAWAFDLSGRPTSCIVYINPSMVAESASSQGLRIPDEVIPHEVFHCFQMSLFPSAQSWGSFYNSSRWVIEGQANWVGCTIASNCDVGQGDWNSYLSNPRVPLFSRSYDAIGFYAEMNYVGIDPWLRLDSMVTASNNDDAYHRALGGEANALEDRWASSYGRSRYRDPSLAAADWDTNGPGIPGIMPTPKTVVVDNGTVVGPFAIPAYTNRFIITNLMADVVFVQAGPHGRASFADHQEVAGAALQDSYYCTRSDECKPPPGCTRSEAPPMTKIAPGKAYFAFTGADSGATIGIRGLSIQKFFSSRAGCSPAPGKPAETGSRMSGGLPDACSLLTQGEATAILRLPTTRDTQLQNPSFASECNYSTARVDPTFAEIDVGIWQHMPGGPSAAGGRLCGRTAICYPVQGMAAYIRARGGMIYIVVGGQSIDPAAVVEQVEAYILQKI